MTDLVAFIRNQVAMKTEGHSTIVVWGWIIWGWREPHPLSKPSDAAVAIADAAASRYQLCNTASTGHTRSGHSS